MKNLLFFISFFLMLPAVGFSESEVVDCIVAKVNDEIILQSEVDESIELHFSQLQKYPTDEEIQQARDEYLNQMVENLILVQEAKNADISVQSSEINQALNETLDNMMSKFPSQQMFEKELEREGLSLVDLKRRYRKDIRNQLMINRLIDVEIRSQIEVSAQDARQLYEKKGDEIPDKPEEVTLSHILIPIEMSDHAEESARELANEVRQIALDGADFADLARQYSDGPSASLGGYLGSFGRGDMVAEFEETAFSMEVGEISEPVRTQFGFHLIKLDEKGKDKVSATHILFEVKPTKQDTLRALEAGTELLQRLQQEEESFAELARQYSADENTREKGGSIGSYALDQLVPPYSDAVDVLSVGEVSQPLKGDFGYHLIRMDAHQASRPMDFEEIRYQLEDMVRQEKMKALYDELIERLKEQNYIEIRSFM
ncbi:MAG: hypothetical protein B6244_03015 [Candidatus Cloacimonetes bacterium 4572_55]|nr:MAG: hypothetical protein B6244_03015 [Candidatus Cloacimonetes bacterium 4572_55]